MYRILSYLMVASMMVVYFVVPFISGGTVSDTNQIIGNIWMAALWVLLGLDRK